MLLDVIVNLARQKWFGEMQEEARFSHCFQNIKFDTFNAMQTYNRARVKLLSLAPDGLPTRPTSVPLTMEIESGPFSSFVSSAPSMNTVDLVLLRTPRSISDSSGRPMFHGIYVSTIHIGAFPRGEGHLSVQAVLLNGYLRNPLRIKRPDLYTYQQTTAFSHGFGW